MESCSFVPQHRVIVNCTGQNTGKEVFACSINKFSPPEINYYKLRHIELEKKFIRSVLKTELTGGVKVRDQLGNLLR
jgi:hypothetical protein